MAKLPVIEDEGRRFGCTRCGNCCVQPGWVFFGLEELKGMAEYLGLTLPKFKARFGVTWEPDERRYAIDATDGSGCPLLSEDRRCQVHPKKPVQCQTFPFWTEMMEGRTVWDEAKKFCPGLDAKTGRYYGPEEIAEILRGDRGT